MDFVGNLLLFAAVKAFCKSIKNWQSYYGGTLFLAHSVGKGGHSKSNWRTCACRQMIRRRRAADITSRHRAPVNESNKRLHRCRTNCCNATLVAAARKPGINQHSWPRQITADCRFGFRLMGSSQRRFRWLEGERQSKDNVMFLFSVEPSSLRKVRRLSSGRPAITTRMRNLEKLFTELTMQVSCWNHENLIFDVHRKQKTKLFRWVICPIGCVARMHIIKCIAVWLCDSKGISLMKIPFVTICCTCEKQRSSCVLMLSRRISWLHAWNLNIYTVVLLNVG